ncbi:MAG: glycosyltransferase [Lachnospiraceae bacterium]|nr:glycosyltransferase [Lachnospiraceae bacterium]
MNIIQIHDTDLAGRNFNGYDLQEGLNARDISCKLIVKQKISHDDNVLELRNRKFVEEQLMILEDSLSVSHLFPPYYDLITELDEFQKADIVHYHMIHHFLLGLNDLPDIMGKKKSVFTIHDPWILTGHCVYPLECTKWRTGCKECTYLDKHFALNKDNSGVLWKLKEQVFRGLDIDIVVSCEWFRKYILESPITKDIKRIHVIPFGIKTEIFEECQKVEARNKLSIALDKKVIGFRLSDDMIKGCQYIWGMLDNIDNRDNLVLLCIGAGTVPEWILEKYQIIQIGWTNDQEKIIHFHTACDIFLMPSLCESFGVMAIEAMAAESVVICFSDTVLEEITDAPDCGVAVKYGDSADLGRKVVELIDNDEELCRRGRRGRARIKEKFQYSDYIDRHIDLYEDIMRREKQERQDKL